MVYCSLHVFNLCMYILNFVCNISRMIACKQHDSRNFMNKVKSPRQVFVYCILKTWIYYFSTTYKDNCMKELS